MTTSYMNFIRHKYKPLSMLTFWQYRVRVARPGWTILYITDFGLIFCKIYMHEEMACFVAPSMCWIFIIILYIEINLYRFESFKSAFWIVVLMINTTFYFIGNFVYSVLFTNHLKSWLCNCMSFFFFNSLKIFSSQSW